MKALFIFLVLFTGITLALSQTLDGSTSITKSAPLVLIPGDPASGQSDVIEGKDFQFHGPLVHPFKSGRLRDVPHGLFQLINPFAPSQPAPEIQAAPRALNPRAWTSTVGWSTGPSSAPVEVTHEPSMGLFSVTTR